MVLATILDGNILCFVMNNRAQQMVPKLVTGTKYDGFGSKKMVLVYDGKLV